MKNFKNKKRIIVVFLLLLVGILFIIFNRALKRPLKATEDIVINVQSGDSFYSVLNRLDENNQITFLPIIKTYVKVTNPVVDIKPGEYKLHKEMSVKDIINTISNESGLNVVDFTIPEGFTINQIANKLETEGICSSEEFIEAITSYDLPSYVKPNESKRYNLEGFLFPDTYKFSKNSNPSELIEKMCARFEEVWSSALEQANVKVKNEDIETVITIASMIEKEARVNDERPIIASVIYNRLNGLNIHKKLQIDATVIYALEDHVEKVLNDHLEIESPYNTYKVEGLPIGPISNPGLPSILAALKPESTDYLFYVLQEDNRHYFTNDDEDFMMKLEELGY